MGHATHARDVRWLYRALGGAGVGRCPHSARRHYRLV